MVTRTDSRMSTLNPDAPHFIPRSFHEAEDFSHEWWDLVQSSPAFRDYWLRERFSSMEDYDSTPLVDDTDEFDFEDLLEMEMQNQDLENAVDMASWKHGNDHVVSDSEKDIISALAVLSVNELRSQQRAWREPLKHHEKISNRSPRSPRKGCNNQFRIQQPRA